MSVAAIKHVQKNNYYLQSLISKTESLLLPPAVFFFKCMQPVVTRKLSLTQLILFISDSVFHTNVLLHYTRPNFVIIFAIILIYIYILLQLNYIGNNNI